MAPARPLGRRLSAVSQQGDFALDRGAHLLRSGNLMSFKGTMVARTAGRIGNVGNGGGD